jgi:multidrug efflux pump subunit AcrB
VANAVQTGNVFMPGGEIYGKYLQFIINPKGQLLRAEDYNDLIIRYQDGAPVRVKDVATPVDGVQKQYLIIDFWTSWMKPRAASLVVAVTPAPGQRCHRGACRARYPREAAASFRLGRSLHRYDRSVQIIQSINDVKTLLIAFTRCSGGLPLP